MTPEIQHVQAEYRAVRFHADTQAEAFQALVRWMKEREAVEGEPVLLESLSMNTLDQNESGTGRDVEIVEAFYEPRRKPGDVT